MKTQYIILIPKTAKNAVLATTELFGQKFKSYKIFENAIKNYDMTLNGTFHIDTFIDDLNSGRVDSVNNTFVPITIKEKNEFRR